MSHCIFDALRPGLLRQISFMSSLLGSIISDVATDASKEEQTHVHIVAITSVVSTGAKLRILLRDGLVGLVIANSCVAYKRSIICS